MNKSINASKESPQLPDNHGWTSILSARSTNLHSDLKPTAWAAIAFIFLSVFSYSANAVIAGGAVRPTDILETQRYTTPDGLETNIQIVWTNSQNERYQTDRNLKNKYFSNIKNTLDKTYSTAAGQEMIDTFLSAGNADNKFKEFELVITTNQSLGENDPKTAGFNIVDERYKKDSQRLNLSFRFDSAGKGASSTVALAATDVWNIAELRLTLPHELGHGYRSALGIRVDDDPNRYGSKPLKIGERSFTIGEMIEEKENAGAVPTAMIERDGKLTKVANYNEIYREFGLPLDKAYDGVPYWRWGLEIKILHIQGHAGQELIDWIRESDFERRNGFCL